MNRSDLRDEIRRILRDTSSDTTKQRWTDTILNNRIDVGNSRVCAQTLCLEGRGNGISAVSATQEYDLPSDYLTERQILYKQSDGTFKKLTKTTEQEMDLYETNWRATAGEPSYYYIRLTKIGLYPTPDTSLSAAIRIDYFKRPAALSADTQYVLGGVSAYYPYHPVVGYDVCRRCLLDDGKLQEAAVYESEFQKGVRELKSQIWRQNDDTRLVNLYETSRLSSRRTR